DTATGGATGHFSWTPSPAQGGQSFNVVFSAFDGSLTTFETIRFTANQPPVLGPVSGATRNEGSQLTFPLSATDPDTPLNTLTFTATILNPNPLDPTLDLTSFINTTSNTSPAAATFDWT